MSLYNWYDLEYNASEIKGILDRFDIKQNKRFRDNISGVFDFKNAGDKKAFITLRMDTPNAEYVVGKWILGEDIDLGAFSKLTDYNFARKGIALAWLDNVKYLTAPTRERKEEKQILNPETNRYVSINKRKFRSLYNQIKMMGVYKELSDFVNLEYNQEHGSCFPSALNYYYSKKLTDRILKKIFDYEKTINDSFNLDEIIQVAKKYKLNMLCKTRTNEVIEKIQYKKSWRGKYMEFIIHDNHCYLVEPSKKEIQSNNPTLIKSIDDIKGEYKNYITNDIDLFDELQSKTDDINAGTYNLHGFRLKNNYIRYDDMAEFKCDVMNKNPKKKSFWGLINRDFALKSYMNQESLMYFSKLNPIRMYSADDGKTNINIDQNKSYYYQLLKELDFPITNINDRFEIYDNKPIVKYAFYYLVVNKTDKIIAPTKEICVSGYTVIELKKQKRVKQIKYVFMPSRSIKVIKSFVEKYNPKIMIRYIGYLQQTIGENINQFDNINDNEYQALRYYYGDAQLSYNGDKTLSIIKRRKKYFTGLLCNFIIKEMTNLDLYKMNKKIQKLNKGLKLKRIYTDSLGYYMDNPDDFKSPKLSNEYGAFKNENTTKITNKTFNKKIIEEPRIDEDLTKEIKQEEIKHLLQQHQGFRLLGGAGYGKSYTINNIIIPHLNSNNKTYKLYGATKMISKSHNTHTFHLDIYGKSDYEIRDLYKDTDYIIIDEASQLTQNILCKLNYIKLNNKTKIILVGDNYQCKSIDAFDDSWLNGYFCDQLCDYNCIKLRYHKNGRYTPEMNDFLEVIKTYIDDDKFRPQSLLKYVLSKLKLEEDDQEVRDGIHICYNRYVNKAHDNIKTTHTIQGQTLDKPYTIYQVATELIFRPRVLYTALSRAKTLDQITIVKGDPYGCDNDDNDEWL